MPGSTQSLKNKPHQKMIYQRILPIKSLSEVKNPWKGVTLNRCILVAIIVILVSSAVEEMEEVLGPYFEEVEGALRGSEGDLQHTGITNETGSWWDTLAFWSWGSDDVDKQTGKRGLRRGEAGERTGMSKIRNREMPTRGLLKRREE